MSNWVGIQASHRRRHSTESVYLWLLRRLGIVTKEGGRLSVVESFDFYAGWDESQVSRVREINGPGCVVCKIVAHELMAG